MFLQVQIVCKENIINFFITIILDKDKKYIKDMLLNSLSNQLNANRKNALLFNLDNQKI